MDLNDSQVARIARRYLDDGLQNLAPGGVPTPLMVAGGAHGVRHVQLHPLTDPDFAETARIVIPAFIVLDEAFEVALAAFTADPGICGESPECGLVAHWGPQGHTVFTSAVTRRATQPPVLGDWLPGSRAENLGPIDDGVRHGFDLTHRIWDSDADALREQIDAIRAAARTEDTDVLPRVVEALRGWGWL